MVRAGIGFAGAAAIREVGPHQPVPPVVLVQRLIQRALFAALRERLQHLVKAKAADFLAGGEFFERGQKLPDVLLRRHE